jgi:glycosyltransferase involved in cell wall biosynthesis
MKVLWFSNTPANSSGYLNKKVTLGSWMAALDKRLQLLPEINLNIAFHYNRRKAPFKYLETNYFPIYTSTTSNKRVFKFINDLMLPNRNKQNIKKYLEIIKIVKPDVIHIHGTENSFGQVIKNTDIPIVYSIQGILSVYNLKYYAGIPKSFFNSIIKPSLLIPGLLHEIQRQKMFVKLGAEERSALKDVKFVIGRTDWDRRVLSILAPKAKYFHNDEVIREQFKSNQWSYNDSGNRSIVIHSTIGTTIYKGLETIYYAASFLYGKIDFTWNIAGIDGNKGIVKIVEKYTKLKHQKIKIKYLGSLEASAIVDKLLTSDVYVHPAHIENSSNAIGEAMLLGMPVIATFSGGTSTMLTNKKEGLLVQDGDPYSLAGAILDIVKNRQESAEYGKNARIKALARHNEDKIIADLLKTYDEMLKFKN